jgi:hypothetical protein
VGGEPRPEPTASNDIDAERQEEAQRDCQRDEHGSEAWAPACLDHRRYRTAGRCRLPRMCRSIKTLRRSDASATTGEIEAAARQFVRKLSGYQKPSAKNTETFDLAIEEVAIAARRMLESFGVPVEEGPDRWTPRHTHPHTA